MKHRFEHLDDDWSDVPATRVIVETDAETLYDVIQAFEDYLRGCGYFLTGDLGIMEDEE